MWFLIFFWKLDPLWEASTMAKGGLEVVCDLREQTGSMMMVRRDDFQRNITVAVAKTVPEYYYYCFFDAAVPYLRGEGHIWLWLRDC
jgi:hypothetical protein